MARRADPSQEVTFVGGNQRVPYHAILVAVFVMFGDASSAENEAHSPTLAWEPKTVELEGRVTQEQRFGPPGFGETPARDTKETIFVLRLDQAISVGEQKGGSHQLVTDQERVQLVISDAELRSTVSQMNCAVLYGSLFPARTGHHYYPVLMTVEASRACADRKN